MDIKKNERPIGPILSQLPSALFLLQSLFGVFLGPSEVLLFGVETSAFDDDSVSFNFTDGVFLRIDFGVEGTSLDCLGVCESASKLKPTFDNRL